MTAAGPVRIALLVQYDGAEFAGSQRQPGMLTVQAALEDAVRALTGAEHRMALAGRTDSGVHASGQVAAFTTTANLDPERWVGGLNHFLPAAVAVQAARRVPDAFDPRRWARERTYEYRVREARERQPLWERRCWVVEGPLDREAMRAALQPLPGTHDFAAFAAPVEAERTTVRTLREARLEVVSGGWRFRFRGESFLPHQVRRTVGQVVDVGCGRAEPGVVRALLERAEPSTAGPAAPPHGLTLVEVRYDVPELADWNGDDDHADCGRSAD